MINIMAYAMTEKFIDMKIIEKNERDIYECGCGLMISEFISTFIVILIGVGMGDLIETLIYLSTFTCIRIYAGGYHASTYNRCISIFTICAFIILILVDWINQSELLIFLTFAMFLADIVIFSLTPVEDMSKSLDFNQKVRYKKISRAIVFVINIVFLFIYYTAPFFRDELSYVSIAICEIAILLIVGYVKNYILSKKNVVF